MNNGMAKIPIITNAKGKDLALLMGDPDFQDFKFIEHHNIVTETVHSGVIDSGNSLKMIRSMTE